jgi:hypothetical protein
MLKIDERRSFPDHNQANDFYDQIKELFSYDSDPELITSPP